MLLIFIQFIQASRAAFTLKRQVLSACPGSEVVEDALWSDLSLLDLHDTMGVIFQFNCATLSERGDRLQNQSVMRS